MSGRYKFTLDGREWSVDEKQAYALQRLKEAMVTIAEGKSSHLGLLEVTKSDDMRVTYLVDEDRDYDKLIADLAQFRVFVTRDALLRQGNAPPENRSIERH